MSEIKNKNSSIADKSVDKDSDVLDECGSSEKTSEKSEEDSSYEVDYSKRDSPEISEIVEAWEEPGEPWRWK